MKGRLFVVVRAGLCEYFTGGYPNDRENFWEEVMSFIALHIPPDEPIHIRVYRVIDGSRTLLFGKEY